MQDYLLIDDFTPNYIKRALHLFPRQGDRDPWRNTQNYTLDKQTIRNAPLEDGVLQFADLPAPAADVETRSAA